MECIYPTCRGESYNFTSECNLRAFQSLYNLTKSDPDPFLAVKLLCFFVFLCFLIWANQTQPRSLDKNRAYNDNNSDGEIHLCVTQTI